MSNQLTPWEKVLRARHPHRPHALDYIHMLCDDFVELHGDRRFGDDQAIVGGPARFNGRTVMLVGQQRGRDTRENTRRNFGMARPEGYRKALRLFQHAQKFRFPLICLIDTPGADPSIQAEERGQAGAIAENMLLLAELRVPIVAIVIGEGGSGGALGIGLCDHLLMLEHAVYSVASPEASATILWNDSAKAAEAAQAMKITAQELHGLGLIDAIVPEPYEGAHADAPSVVRASGLLIQRALDGLTRLSTERLLDQRYRRYRAIGQYATVLEQRQLATRSQQLEAGVRG